MLKRLDATPDGARTTLDVRGLRYAADYLTVRANQERVRQIQARGVETYLSEILGDAAEYPARSCLLVWPNKTERVFDIVEKTLYQYLCWRAKRGHGLPQATVVRGEKIYL